MFLNPDMNSHSS